MSSDDLLRQQIELTKKIIERMDYMIDGVKKELNVEKFYTPSGKKEWVGIPDSLDEMIDRVFVDPTQPVFPMPAQLDNDVMVVSSKEYWQTKHEMDALRAIIEDMRGQIDRQAFRELEKEKEYSKLIHDNMRLVKNHEQ